MSNAQCPSPNRQFRPDRCENATRSALDMELREGAAGRASIRASGSRFGTLRVLNHFWTNMPKSLSSQSMIVRLYSWRKIHWPEPFDRVEPHVFTSDQTELELAKGVNTVGICSAENAAPKV